MLTYLLFTLLLIPLSENWHLLINLSLMLSFFWMLSTSHNFFVFNLGINLATDSISYILTLLSIWILVLVLYASQNILQKNMSAVLFSGTSVILCLLLIITVSAGDVLFFFIAFESSLIPTLILIIGWGYQPKRIQAGVYMLFYTLFGSLPLLVSILSIYFSKGTLVFGVRFHPLLQW